MRVQQFLDEIEHWGKKQKFSREPSLQALKVAEELGEFSSILLSPHLEGEARSQALIHEASDIIIAAFRLLVLVYGLESDLVDTFDKREARDYADPESD